MNNEERVEKEWEKRAEKEWVKLWIGRTRKQLLKIEEMKTKFLEEFGMMPDTIDLHNLEAKKIVKFYQSVYTNEEVFTVTKVEFKSCIIDNCQSQEDWHLEVHIGDFPDVSYKWEKVEEGLKYEVILYGFR
jgi:hypothetical protein